MEINTTHGLMDEADLLKSWDGVWSDNETEQSTVVEYCLKDCTGQSHQTGKPDSLGHFCNHHVHRSAHVTLKKNVAGAGGIASFG